MRASSVAASAPWNRRPELGLAAERLLLGALPVALTAWLALSAIRFHWIAQDFSLAYYPAAGRLLHGASPYAVTHGAVVSGAAFVYPALAAVVLTPFALLPAGPSAHLYTLLCLCLVLGTPWAAGVRDWRVYGIVLLWFPVIIGWQGENVSVAIAFLVALAWRHRERPLPVGLVTAAAVSLKPFAWPLALWLIATRRWKAAGWALACGLLLNLLAWGLIGFDQIHTYLRLSREVTDALWRGGYGPLAVAHQLGLGRGAGEALLLVLALVVGVSALITGLVRRREREALILIVLLMLVASPLVWIHYFALLLVPLSLGRPRLGPVWAIPLAMWLLPPATSVAAWQLALAWVLCGLCLAPLLRGFTPRPPAPAGPLLEALFARSGATADNTMAIERQQAGC